MVKRFTIKTSWTLPADKKKLLIYFVLFYSIFAELLISMLGLPSFIRYLTDVIVLMLFVYSLGRIMPAFHRTRSSGTLALMVTLIFSLVVGLLFNGGKVLLILWASRNTLRFFAYFIACVVFLDREDMLKLLNSLYRLRWLHLFLCLFQYFVMGKEQDYLGGIFGVQKGCNAGLNVYLCFIIAYAACRYLDGREKIGSALGTLVMSLLIAALAELKILYVEVVLIIVLAAMLGRKSRKTWAILLAVIVGIVVGLMALKAIFPDHYEILMGMTQMLEYDNADGSAYQLSRLFAFENINELFFGENTLLKLFGLGFGNCEYSNFSFLTSDFYRTYGHYNYRWFSLQMMYLETGLVGFGLYIAILGSILFTARKAMRANSRQQYLFRMVVIYVILTVIGLWYNAAIKGEPGYLIFLILAAAAVCQKERPAVLPKGILPTERNLSNETVTAD